MSLSSVKHCWVPKATASCQSWTVRRPGSNILSISDSEALIQAFSVLSVLLDPPGGIGLQPIHLLRVIYERQKDAVG